MWAQTATNTSGLEGRVTDESGASCLVKATYGQFNFALRASDSRTIRNFNKNDYSAQIYRWTDTNKNRDLQSGHPPGLTQLSTVTLRMEPLGAIRLPAVKLLNVRASKQLMFGSHRITIDGDFYNLLNANDATTMTVASGPSFGRITVIVPPRVARIGFSYHF